jgi:predicted PilT family ATPase
VLRISRDVIVKKGKDDEFIALSGHAGIVVGDELTIALAAEDPETANVRVTASRPVMVDGVVKYELRLTRVDRDA